MVPPSEGSVSRDGPISDTRGQQGDANVTVTEPRRQGSQEVRERQGEGVVDDQGQSLFVFSFFLLSFFGLFFHIMMVICIFLSYFSETIGVSLLYPGIESLHSVFRILSTSESYSIHHTQGRQVFQDAHLKT